ncbi:DUF1295 domain-containing protein [Cellulophaga sp. BC115SP]|uniref:DUF1295 domain-containing protein n=1 Tax=Cellulophaga sp. BC115SP TaxID=2683263 RepID=UPI00196B053E|nr:DUF1295 domain-containing protein [Cellulophaga sp. BC115SP]
MKNILLLVMAISLLGGMVVLSYFFTPLAWGAGLLWLCLTLLWLWSLRIKDSSIIDSFWGMGFVILAWLWYGLLPDSNPRALVLCVLVSIWGIRLSTHIAVRNHGKGEDYRYQAFREAHGDKYWWRSYFRVYLLQGILLWLISLPLFFTQHTPFTGWTWVDALGGIVWLAGFVFEALGDWQLAQFKANPQNKGKVFDSGLWQYTRHPNYFGDAVLWWGYFGFAVAAGAGWTVLSPLLMTFLLMKVSGVALLEERLVETKPQYLDYMSQTPAFFPKFWR